MHLHSHRCLRNLHQGCQLRVCLLSNQKRPTRQGTVSRIHVLPDVDTPLEALQRVLLPMLSTTMLTTKLNTAISQRIAVDGFIGECCRAFNVHDKEELQVLLNSMHVNQKAW